MISGFATMTLGRDERTESLQLQHHFDNIPRRAEKKHGNKGAFSCFFCACSECFGVFNGFLKGLGGDSEVFLNPPGTLFVDEANRPTIALSTLEGFSCCWSYKSRGDFQKDNNTRPHPGFANFW